MGPGCERHTSSGIPGEGTERHTVLLLPSSLETSGKEPTWNFWKYLVAPDGKVVGAWDPTVPMQEIKPRITELVAKLILQRREEL